MRVISVLLIALLLIVPAGLVYGMNIQDTILSPHIKMIELGDRPFSNVETFNLDHNHFKIYKQFSTTMGYSSFNLNSPLGDHIIANYSVTIHRSPFNVDFLQPDGYTPMYFSGQKAVQFSFYFAGYTSFKYMTLVYVIDNFGGGSINGISINGVNDMSGYPIYNVSISISNESYNIYIPGFLKVNKNVVTIFLRSFEKSNNLILEMSFNINDGYFQTLFSSVISSSYEDYANQYMSLLNEQGQYFGIYPTILQNYYSIIIGIIIFTAIFFMVYVIYRRK